METNDIGFVLIKLNNDIVYNMIMDTINKFIQDRPFDQIVIFNSDNSRVGNKNIPILHLSHAQFFTGKLVLFDIPSTLVTKNFTNVSSRYLYATDTPWTHSLESMYTDWLEIYSHQNLELIVSNNALYDIYNIMWKKPRGISENFNYDQIKNII